MNENIEHIMLEHLKAIRSDMSKMSDNMNTLRAEMISLRAHISGINTLQEHDHIDLASLKARLERIEKRLDLVD